MKNKGGKFFLITVLILTICLGFFIGQKCQASKEVIINEIAWMGGENSTADEWIELKNTSDTEIDLSSWTLEVSNDILKFKEIKNNIISANACFLLERTDDDSVANISADIIYTGELNNSGENLILKNNNGEIIDSIDFSNEWTYNNEKAGDKDNKKTAEYCDNFWQTASLIGGTPKAPNTCSISESTENTENNEESLPEENFNDNDYNYGQIVINEFLSNPEEGETEWIELYTSKTNIDLSGWYISDGSETKTILSGKSSGSFFLLEKPKGALNNTGDEISLLSPSDELFDHVAYGDWGNSVEKNIPSPPKGASASRIEDGLKKSSLQDSFSISSKPTPGQANIIIEINQEESSTTEKTSANDISITEILPNPTGSDRETEFIELKNNSEKEIDLSGWSLAVKDGRIFTFGKFFAPSASIAPGGYFVLYRSESKLVLENNSGSVRLFKPNSSRASQILEYENAPEGASFINTSIVSTSSSETTKNFLLNSLNPSSWTWTYRPTPGVANEILILNRPPIAKFFLNEKIATGTPLIFDASDTFDEDGDDLFFSWDFGDGIKINGETVSHTFLKNGQYEINLSVNDGQAESIFKKNIIFPENFNTKKIIEANNTTKNSNASANQKPIILNDNLSAIVTQKDDDFSYTSLEKIKDKPAGQNISVSGVVIVAPNIYGTQYFYISSPVVSNDGLEVKNSSTAIKIYNFKKDFPELKIGDLVNITGQIMQNKQEKYIKTAKQEDIIISGQGELAKPEEKNILTLDDLNKFSTIEGEISQKDSTRFFLENNSGQTSIYLKSGANIDKSVLKIGAHVKISGLVGIINKDPELLPRNQGDVYVFNENNLQAPTTNKPTKENNNSSTSWILPNRKKNNSTFYFLIIISAGVLVLSAWFLKKRLKK